MHHNPGITYFCLGDDNEEEQVFPILTTWGKNNREHDWLSINIIKSYFQRLFITKTQRYILVGKTLRQMLLKIALVSENAKDFKISFEKIL